MARSGKVLSIDLESVERKVVGIQGGGSVCILGGQVKPLLGARAPSPAQRAEHAQLFTSLDRLRDKPVRASRSMRARAPAIPVTSCSLKLKLTHYCLGSPTCKSVLTSVKVTSLRLGPECALRGPRLYYFSPVLFACLLGGRKRAGVVEWLMAPGCKPGGLHCPT